MCRREVYPRREGKTFMHVWISNTYCTHHIEVKGQNGNSSRFVLFELHEIWWTEKSPTFRANLFCTYRCNVAKVFIVHLKDDKQNTQFSIMYKMRIEKWIENLTCKNFSCQYCSYHEQRIISMYASKEINN